MTTKVEYNDIPIDDYLHWLKRSWFMSKSLHKPVMVETVNDSINDTLLCCDTYGERYLLQVGDLDIRLPVLGYKNLTVQKKHRDRRKQLNKKVKPNLDIDDMYKALVILPQDGPPRHPRLLNTDYCTKVASYLSYSGQVTYKKGFTPSAISNDTYIFDTTLCKTVRMDIQKILTINNIESIFNTHYPKLIEALWDDKPTGYQTALSENFAIASVDLGIRNPIYNYVLMYRGRVIGFLSKLYGQSSFKSRVKLHDNNKYLLPILIEEFKQDNSVKFV